MHVLLRLLGIRLACQLALCSTWCWSSFGVTSVSSYRQIMLVHVAIKIDLSILLFILMMKFPNLGQVILLLLRLTIILYILIGYS